MLYPFLSLLLAFLLPPARAVAPEPGSAQETSGQVELVKGRKMVRIAGGWFEMGRNTRPGDPEAQDIDNPRHRIQVDSFYLDLTPVTNAEYFHFCQTTGHRLPFFWGMREFRSGLDWPDHPVVGVSHRDAQAFASWIGLRLPSEAEWEYAARGGLSGKDYPGGDDLKPEEARFAPYAVGPERVGQLRPNGYGLFDMVGNVAQWVVDFYDKDYYRKSPERNPKGPSTGRFHVIRGGGWYARKSCNRVFFRNALPANWVDFNVGFRCANDASPDSPGGK